MQLNQNRHLTYCTNIHPGQDWEATFNSLKQHVPSIKQALSPKKPFGLGLRLSNLASAELGLENRMAAFQQWLRDEQVYVFTMNGFPYGNFHHEKVKDMVHAPDWTTPERLAYTTRLFDQLAVLLPKGLEGGVSTSPISYKHWHGTAVAKKKALAKGAEQLVGVALHLHHLEQTSGKYMHLDIEPEPDGLLENTREVLAFFNEELLPVGIEIIGEAMKVGATEAQTLLKRHITLCYDICHFSLAYEEPEQTFEQLANAGIKVGKIQVSAALKVLFKGGDDDAIWNALQAFDEPTYLHQVTEKTPNGVSTYADLPEVLAVRGQHRELRAHFHVPIFVERYGSLHSTQDHIVKTLAYLRKHDLTSHLEVETYTWEVLPAGMKENITNSIVRELQWLLNEMGK
ncbi:metabolite traffic protein EboE [Maribacter sp. 2307ULW6-5]|uniref:metabolite traffic protein EboE n=1 Tax=Maribacter sp. 2307ULW6-5 TaxID=3386275 RepID=UPI0039BCE476